MYNSWTLLRRYWAITGLFYCLTLAVGLADGLAVGRLERSISPFVF
jgi:hypothetical protein